MIDVFQVANTMALTSTCKKCREGGVVVSHSTGNVVSVCRSYCTIESTDCAHSSARGCPCFVSAYGDLIVQGTEKLKNTQVYVVSESYPTGVDCSDLSKLLGLCGAEYVSFNKLGAKLSKPRNSEVKAKDVSKKVNKSHKHEQCDNHDNKPQTELPAKTYGTRTCKKCGREFVATHPRQLYCHQYKIGVCKVCHKVYQYRCSSYPDPETCDNPECRRANRIANLIPRAKKS